MANIKFELFMSTGTLWGFGLSTGEMRILAFAKCEPAFNSLDLCHKVLGTIVFKKVNLIFEGRFK